MSWLIKDIVGMTHYFDIAKSITTTDDDTYIVNDAFHSYRISHEVAENLQRILARPVTRVYRAASSAFAEVCNG